MPQLCSAIVHISKDHKRDQLISMQTCCWALIYALKYHPHCHKSLFCAHGQEQNSWKNCEKVFCGRETRAPAKVVLALKLISTIFRLKWQVLDAPLKSIDTLFVVNIQNVLNKKTYFFTPFLICSDTCMGYTAYVI